jgi:hypothetical protein
MIAHVIAAIIGNYLTSVFVLGLIIAGIRVGRLGRPRAAAGVSAILIMDVVISTIGLLFVAWNALARRADAANRGARATEARLAVPAAHSAH